MGVAEKRRQFTHVLNARLPMPRQGARNSIDDRENQKEFLAAGDDVLTLSDERVTHTWLRSGR
jgi:hypothetical protein